MLVVMCDDDDDDDDDDDRHVGDDCPDFYRERHRRMRQSKIRN